MTDNTRHNTPPVKDYGHGGEGQVSNTSFPESPGAEDAAPMHRHPGYETGGDYAQNEAEAAMREFDNEASS